ncbi:MAG: PorT family protein [Pedobacter sp.]|nr:MAG: PorT family protein [Pedobacter sp.]
MKNILITALFVAVSAVSFGQTKPVKVGFKAGITLPSISAVGGASAYDGPEPLDYRMNTSFYIGGVVDLPLSKLFSIQPGLTLVNKGAKYTFVNRYNINVDSFSGKLNLMYIEIPVNGIFSLELGKGEVFFGGGPYYAFAVDGHTKSTNTGSNKYKVQFGEDKDYRRTDVGLNLLLGYKLNNGLNVHAGYGIGLKTITGGNVNFFQEKNKVLSFGFGLYL